MSRFQIPVSYKTLWSTGDVKLWIDVELNLKDSAGNLVPAIFRVDTGTEITTFPAYNAKRLGLPMPINPVRGVTHKQTGLEMRSGYIRFRVVGMDQTEYFTTCLFLGDPATPLDPSRPAALPRNLLQPLALLGQLEFMMKKDPNVGSIYGELVVEKK
jgi:hypothetical protein